MTVLSVAATLEPEEAQEIPAVAVFIAELRHWREVTGYSQKALAKLTGYTPSYVSKVERGTMLASRSFAESADQHLRAGRALIRRWKDMHDVLVEMSDGRGKDDERPVEDAQSAPAPAAVAQYRTQPVTRYLIRITADRYPGDPERSHLLYREDPLTWKAAQPFRGVRGRADGVGGEA